MIRGMLGDFVDFAYGKNLPARNRRPGNIPVFGSAGVIDTHNQAIAKGPGIIVGRKGTIGSINWSDTNFYPIDTTYYVVMKNDKLRLRYLYYLLKTLPLKHMNTDVAVPGLNKNNLLKLPVLIVPLQEQDKIISILSTYDNLIENNRRRIQLLEESARLLYKEWFVHLRFPGHEHVKIVDGVPEGWERKRIGEMAPFKYGKSLKKDIRVPGPFPVYGSSGIIGSHEKALIKGPTIIIGRKGNVGSVYWSSSDCYPIDTVYFIDSDNSSIYLYYALLNTSFISTDVAVPGLNREYAHSQKILVPDLMLLGLFEEFSKNIHKQIDQLTEYNQMLSQGRGLLLPRLMNGEVTI